ncbi:hypothetical protein H2201_008466 [Coniosporium apollinis]|uniref:Enoyl-CoA hydratase n=1 Tax=Coniosporium apollinis TaxID=61459 RepID=A0ABQ9NIM4_9PEZI|nr:hypothetical protein H2201_008466 [Coniosporium apollinis]
MPPPPTIALPTSYNDLQWQQIKTSHHPASSPTPTATIVLTLYRPGKHNAFTNTMMEELERAFEMFDVDDRVKCVVVTGHGRIFCAGADLEMGFKTTRGERIEDHRDGGGRVVLAIHRCRKPTIGAITGSAVGVGITMTLPMTIRIALSSAKIGFVFSRRGLVMEACSSFFLPRLIGLARSLHVVTTGLTYPASDKVWGPLFSETYDTPEKVLSRALELADEVTQNTSIVSSYLMRELMYRDRGSAEGQHLLDSRILYELFSSADNAEGVKSFMEKRPAKFTGTMENSAPHAYPWWEPVHTTGPPKAEQQLGKAKL